MSTGKQSGGSAPIIIALITAIGGWGTALITNWSAVFPDEEARASKLPQTWKLTEGGGREWTGIWEVTAYGSEFTCTQSHPKHGQLNAKCIVVTSDNFIAVRKFDVSDSNPCNYFGVRAGSTITGKYFCRSGGPYDWTVSVK